MASNEETLSFLDTWSYPILELYVILLRPVLCRCVVYFDHPSVTSLSIHRKSFYFFIAYIHVTVTIHHDICRYSTEFDIINYVNCPETSNSMCDTGIWQWLRCPIDNVIIPYDVPTEGDVVAFSNSYKQPYYAFDVAFRGGDSKQLNQIDVLKIGFVFNIEHMSVTYRTPFFRRI